MNTATIFYNIVSFKTVICIGMKFRAKLNSVGFKFLEKIFKTIQCTVGHFLVTLRNVTHKNILFYQLKSSLRC